MRIHLLLVVSPLLLVACGKPAATSCTVHDDGTGIATISCPDGTSATVSNGTNGSNGSNGTNGTNGTSGSDGTNGTNGSSGHSALLAVADAPVGACTAGGEQVSAGIDNGDGGGVADDGTLQPGEIDSTSLLCNGVDGTNGANGANGTDGTDGHSALVSITAASAAQCSGGGSVVTAGVDDGAGGGAAGDGALQAGEVDSTAIVCNGSSCTVANHGDGTSSMSCPDGTSTTWWSGVFPRVNAGPDFACGIRSADSTLRCWGNNGIGQTNAPTGSFLSVSSGGTNSCAIRSDHTVACWGVASATNAAPSGTFRSVEVGGWSFGGTTAACGVRSDQTLTCWGPAATPVPTGSFVTAAPTYQDACALRIDGTLTCWGPLSSWTATPAGTFKTLSGGFNHQCAISTSDTVSCWGFGGGGGLNAPTGTFRSVSAGYDFSCGVRATNGAVVCWGADNGGVVSTAPAGVFESVSAGDSYACAVRDDGQLICWGSNGNGRATPPAGQFP